jgi:hypothetical protein
MHIFVHLLQAWRGMNLSRARSRLFIGPCLVPRDVVPRSPTGPHFLDASMHVRACITAHHNEPVALHRQLVSACDPPSGNMNLMTHAPCCARLSLKPE